VVTSGPPLLRAGVITREFLSKSECAKIARGVIGLRDHWRDVPSPPGWTGSALGTASYLDASESADPLESNTSYLAAAARTNPILSSVFGDLYNRLREFLENLLDEPVAYQQRLALPGFQIWEFQGHKLVDDRGGWAHFDVQSDPDRTALIFTLPLEQPTGGASLAVWPLRYEEAIRRNLSTSDFAEQNPCEQVRHTTGRMILHDGLALHALGPTRGPAPKGRRMTLQGIGLRSESRWTIFW
jgi:hypothetical protein